ncbi:MAG: S8 family peptidase [Anaerolineae bacterium]
MRYRIAVATLLLVVLVCAGFAAPARAQSDAPAPFAGILVRFQPALSRAEIDQALAAQGLQAVEYQSDLKVYRAQAQRGANLAAVLIALKAEARVVLAEPNYIVRAVEARPAHLPLFLPTAASGANDPLYHDQWGLQRIQAARAWPAVGGRMVTIAIIDSGVELTHPDLRARIVRGYNFVIPGAPPQDDLGHGTHVAGIAAAIQNNHVGVAGTATGVQILPLKILDASGYGTIANLALAMRYAVRRNARVISLSLGTGEVNQCPTVLQEAADFAYSRGTLVVAAAGNLGEGAPFFPAACNHVMSVNSTDYTDRLSYFSNFSDWVSISAPGEDILSTVPGATYDYNSGTSMATPFVAGTAAMLYLKNPSAPPDQIEQEIEFTADRFPWMSGATGYGGGRLNAGRAVAGER